MIGRSMFFMLALTLALSMVSLAHPRTISERTARRLVQEALGTLGENRPAVQIGPWKYYWAPEFYTFSAWRAGEQDVLVPYYFAVNPWTGDVWDAMGCKRITSPAIAREQESIGKRFRLPVEARKALHAKSPACCSEIRQEMSAKPK